MMAANEGSGADPDRDDGRGGYRNIREISEIQIRYILENNGDAAIYPPRRPDDPDPAPVEFVYRRLHLLTRDQDLADVLGILNPPRYPAPGVEAGAPRVGEVTHPIPGLALVRLAYGGPDDPVSEAGFLFSALAEVEQQLGPGKAAPEHMVHITPGTGCPATEPDPEPGDAVPCPGVSRSCCDGRGTRVAVVDTGLVPDAPARHPWLHGVTGQDDPLVNEGVSIERYGCHGTFIASVIRAMAPRAEVRITRDYDKTGALYESCMVKALLSVLDWAPDVINLSGGTHTWKHRGLLSFQVFVNGPLRECPGTILVAAAGNDAADWKFAPAEMKGVVGVGALGWPGDARAWFSNYGDWVTVYAPGQDLVHAFGRGEYAYQELRAGQTAWFDGMARWSGTSFSTPVVAGLIAARMSGTGEGSHEAAESLLQLARAQALPGVGPVLRPGQACLCLCRCEQPGRPCRCEQSGRETPHRHCGCR